MSETPLLALFGTGDMSGPRFEQWRRLAADSGLGLRVDSAPLGEGRARLGALAWLARLIRLPWRWALLTWQALRGPRPSAYLVLYPGHLDVYLAVMLARLRRGPRAPVALDLFVGLHETLVEDRQRVRPGSALAGALRLVDRGAAWACDLLIADTEEHAELWRRSGIRGARLAVLPICAPIAFEQAEARVESERRPLEVLQVTTHIPLHGGEVVVGAAELLDGEGFVFRLIGDGQRRAALERRAGARVEFLDRVPLARLPERLREADVVLGIFGGSAKARAVIPHKVVQALACGRPIVTSDSAPQRRLLGAPVAAILVPPADPEALAAALRRCRDEAELRARLARAARSCYAGLLDRQSDRFDAIARALGLA